MGVRPSCVIYFAKGFSLFLVEFGVDLFLEFFQVPAATLVFKEKVGADSARKAAVNNVQRVGVTLLVKAQFCPTT